jgi:phage terminase large subunit-like protein
MPSRTASPPSAPPAAPKPPGRTRCTVAGCRKLARPGLKRCGGDHKRDRPPGRGPGRGKLIGSATPRLFTRPRRPLTRQTSRGYEVIDFARLIGEPLLPWQEFAVIHALELNPDGTYRYRTVLLLVARQNGKSHLLRVLTLWRMYIDGARRILGVAQDVALARDQWQMCQDTIHGCPDLEAEWGGVRNVNGDEKFWAGTGRYAIKAANGKAGRGGSNEMVIIDELREQHDDKGWAAVSKTTMARRDGQVWAASNAGSDASTVLNDLRAAALAGNDPSLCLLEWSAPDNCDLGDPKAWAQANPGLGHIITEQAIASARGTDRAATFRTEVLCQRVEQLEGAIDYERWKACADPAGTLDGHRRHVCAGIDVSPDGKHVTLAVAAMLEDGRIRGEIANAWDSTDEARRELPAILDRMKPQAIAWYPTGPGAAFATMLRSRRGSMELTGGKASEACMELADLTVAGSILQPDDPLLNAHVANAAKLPSGDGWRFTRKGDGIGHVDAAYAFAGAVKAANTLGPRKRSRIRILAA